MLNLRFEHEPAYEFVISKKKKYEEEVAKGNELSTVRNKDKVISFEFTVISALIRAIH